MKKIGRPVPNPSQGFVVRPGNMMAMLSPMPCILMDICCLNPTPKAMSTTIATVPQMMPNMVRNARSFCALRSR